MSDRAFKYDVALSFLSADEPLASEIHSRLSEQMEVFVYSKRQEELAGTDGLASLRSAFLTESRIVVVLYREGWGKTPWTRVEETAIKDRFLEHGWDWLLVVMLDDSKPPPWLPRSEIRLNFAQYGLEQALGAIKTTAARLGATVRAETAVDRAARVERDARLRRERQERLDTDGRSAGPAEFVTLQKLVVEKLDAAKARMKEIVLEFGTRAGEIVMRTQRASVNIHGHWTYPATESCVVIQEWNGILVIPQEDGRRYQAAQPDLLRRRLFYLDYQSAYGWCWRDESSKQITTDELAEICVRAIFDLHDACESGKIAAPKPFWERDD